MKMIRSALTSIQGALNDFTDPIHRARLRILFSTLAISLVFAVCLFFIYLFWGPPLQFFRICVIICALSYGMYHLVRSHNYKPAAHITLLILNMLVWTNIFLVIQAINIVTIQYILLTITCSFYLLNGRFGIFYSALVLVPVVYHILLHGISDIQVYGTNQQASDAVFVTIMGFNFFLMVFVHYQFLKAFQFTIDRLKTSQQDVQRANDQLKDAVQIAEASSRAKSDFLSTMSHELRTPLNSVIGMSFLLMENHPRDDQQENLKALNFSAESLLGLINGILDFNKLEYGKIELERVGFIPSDLINQLYAGLKFQADEKGLNFELEIDPEIDNITVVGDSTRLLQILFNLLGNAIKFTNKGTVKLKVELSILTEEEVTMKFWVSDTGIGIAPQELSVIFEPFSQASSAITRRFGGTGLGLAITKQLLELHDSELAVNSELGLGTTFHFDIKYHYSAFASSKLDLGEIKGGSGTQISGIRILVAEDNAMNVLLLKKLFDSWVLHAEFVQNGYEAVQAVNAAEYDVVFMDIHMPVMDGYEASRLILADAAVKGKKPWVVALTASVASDIGEKIKEAGMDDYILKPFNPLELKSKLALMAKLKSARSRIIGEVST